VTEFLRLAILWLALVYARTPSELAKRKVPTHPPNTLIQWFRVGFKNMHV
jgi:hypothetical protein